MKKSNEAGYKDNVEKYLFNQWNKTITEKDIILHLGDLYFHNNKSKEFNISKLNELNGNKILIKGNHDRNNYLNKLDSSWFIIEGIYNADLSDKENKKFNSYLGKSKELKKDNEEIYELYKNQKNINLVSAFIKTIELNQYSKETKEENITKIKKKIMFTHYPLFRKELEYDKKYSNIIKIFEYVYKYYKCDINIHGHIHSNEIKNSTIVNINASVEVLEDMKPTTIKELIKV